MVQVLSAGNDATDTIPQVVLEEFKLGRFQSAHHRGCPDGHLQVEDGNGGNSNSGQFCGLLAADGPRPVFVSDSRRLTATIRFFQFYGDYPEQDFSFSIKYKFLENATARTR